MSVSVGPSVEDSLRKIQTHFRELISVSNLEYVLQGFVSILRTHEAHFARMAEDQKVVITLENSIARLSSKIDVLEAGLKEKDNENMRLYELLHQAEKKILANLDRIEKAEQDLQLMRMTRDGRDREIVELREGLRSTQDKVAKCSVQIETLECDIQGSKEQVQEFKESFAHRLILLDKTAHSKMDADAGQTQLDELNKDRRDLRSTLAALTHRLDRNERSLVMEMQGLRGKLDEKLDKSVLPSLEDVLARGGLDDGGAGGGNAKLQLRCLSCRSITSGGTNDTVMKPEAGMQSFQSFIQTAVQQTKQYNVVGADGKLYKGRDEVFTDEEEASFNPDSHRPINPKSIILIPMTPKPPPTSAHRNVLQSPVPSMPRISPRPGGASVSAKLRSSPRKDGS